MLFNYAPICLLLVAIHLAPTFGQTLDESADSSAPTLVGNSLTITELDTSEPYLWQMAAFAARQMSTKQKKFKLATLTSAEQVDSIYRLKVTLQRVTPGQPLDKNDVLYCTVEVKTDSQGQQWNVDNFGCTLPALVRRRRPQQKKPAATLAEPAVVSNKFEQPIDNTISNNIDVEPSRNHVKRQTRPIYQFSQPRYVLPTYPQYQVYYGY